MKTIPLKVRTYNYALRIVGLCRRIRSEFKEFILTDQLLRSGTSPGSHMHEAEFAESKADYIHKHMGALKEANESTYWLRLLKDSGFLSVDEFNAMFREGKEIISILVTTVKTLKSGKT